MAFLIDGKKYKISAGDKVQILPNVHHAQVFIGPVKFINYTSPGFFENVIKAGVARRNGQLKVDSEEKWGEIFD